MGVVQAYSGIPLVVFGSAVALLLTSLFAVLILLPAPGSVLAVVVAGVSARALTHLAGFGALIATKSGIEFVPYVANMRRPKLDEAKRAPWAEVRTTVGLVSDIEVAGAKVQVGPRNRAFAEAAARVAGGQ